MTDFENGLGFLLGVGIAGLMVWLLVGACWELMSRSDVRREALNQLRNHPARAIVKTLMVLSVTATAVFMVLAWVGYEPEIGDTGWRFWTAIGLAAVFFWFLEFFIF